jgi:hypothetical protein
MRLTAAGRLIPNQAAIVVYDTCWPNQLRTSRSSRVISASNVAASRMRTGDMSGDSQSIPDASRIDASEHTPSAADSLEA